MYFLRQHPPSTDILSQVAFTAFQQYTAARDLQRKMKEYFPSDSQAIASPNDSKAGETTVEAPQDPGPPDAARLSQAAKEARRHKWTIVHSYFAAMGGFAVQMADDELNIFPKPDEKKPRLARLTLTPEAIVHLEQKKPGFIPDLSQSFIEDKSKGGTFAKAVVCFQGSLFTMRPCGYSKNPADMSKHHGSASNASLASFNTLPSAYSSSTHWAMPSAL